MAQMLQEPLESGQGYYRIPRVLFTDNKYSGLPTDAKMLYGLLLDRLCLSKKNGWTDKSGRTYVYYTIGDLMKAFHCKQGKAIALLRALEKKEVGLIVRKRAGNGLPSRIYVREFMMVSPGGGGNISPIDKEKADQTSGNRNSDNQKSPKADFRKPERGNPETGTQRAEKGSNIVHFPQNFQQPDTGTPKTGGQNSENRNPDFRKPERSYTESIYPEKSDSYLPPLVPTGRNPAIPERAAEEDANPREKIQRQIEYDTLCQSRPDDRERLQYIVSLLTETLNGRQQALRVNGADCPAAEVKKRLLSLDSGHIEYALDVLAQTKADIGSMHAYLLTVLYNAAVPGTVDLFYDNWVKRDNRQDTQESRRYAV